MLGDKISATEAAKMGMIYKTSPDDILMDEAFKIAEKLSKMPTKSLGLTKRALNLSSTNNLTEQLKIEEKLQTAASKTYDYAEGVGAFLEKRPAKFKGN
jgi:2-(1,2-epoxy-1,2-dihydrophenyl)acetyl-CoA isomerase